MKNLSGFLLLACAVGLSSCEGCGDPEPPVNSEIRWANDVTVFETADVDAVTLSPYMGFDSVEPFLQYPGKGVYLLGVTSNAGAADLETHDLASGRKVFELVGDMASRASDNPAGEGSIGLVLGLTNVSDDVLARMPDVPLLIPGLGAQGGDLETLRGANRTAPNVINVSRGILYADEHLSFTEKAKDYANRIADIA